MNLSYRLLDLDLEAQIVVGVAPGKKLLGGDPQPITEVFEDLRLRTSPPALE